MVGRLRAGRGEKQPGASSERSSAVGPWPSTSLGEKVGWRQAGAWPGKEDGQIGLAQEGELVGLPRENEREKKEKRKRGAQGRKGFFFFLGKFLQTFPKT